MDAITASQFFLLSSAIRLAQCRGLRNAHIYVKMPCGTKGLANPIFGLVGTTGGPQAVGWLVVGAGGRRQVERSLTCDLGRGWRTGTLAGH